ncbi:MAG: hypothetical protein WBV90_04015 [Terrimicrobiaceae bacterium]
MPYWSSHLEGARSELIVPSGHNAIQNPQAIAEARSILRAHADNFPTLMRISGTAIYLRGACAGEGTYYSAQMECSGSRCTLIYLTVQFKSTIATIAALRIEGNFCHALITRFNSGSAGVLALCESPCESGVVSN